MTINEVEAAPKVGFAAVTAEDKNETDANTFTPRVILESGKTSDYPVKIIWDIDEVKHILIPLYMLLNQVGIQT